MTTIRIGKINVRRNRHGHFCALDAFKALGLNHHGFETTYKELREAHSLQYPLGWDTIEGEQHATMRPEDFATLVQVLETPETKRLQKKAQDIFRRYLEGDILLASEVADRSPHTEDRKWLAARLENNEAKRKFESQNLQQHLRSATQEQQTWEKFKKGSNPE
jgi:hypothetical protein